MNVLKTITLIATTLSTLNSCSAPTPHACTQIGCVDGFTLRLDHNKWLPGEYRFDVEVDGKKTVCTATLPFTSCNVPEPCSSQDVRISLSGCALPSSQHSIYDLATTATFKEMKLRLTYDGSTLLERTFHPEFKTSQPNGPGCEPICTNASDSAQF